MSKYAVVMFCRFVSWQQSWVSCHWRRCWRPGSSLTCRQHRKINDKTCCGAGWKKRTLTHLTYAGDTTYAVSLVAFRSLLWLLLKTTCYTLEQTVLAFQDTL